MVYQQIKFIVLIFAVTIGVFRVVPDQANATSLYDMSRFLSQTHPFDKTRPQRLQDQTPTAQQKIMAPALDQSRQVAPISPIFKPLLPGQAPKAKNILIASRGDKNDHLLGFISEIRFGALAHDYGPFSSHKEDGFDLNTEFLFTSPKFLGVIWAPRPHLGVVRNSAKRTSQLYAGLTWDWSFWNNYFFEFAWGASRHNGNTTQENIEFKDLGCKTLFREALELGYKLGNHGLSLHFSHISNGKLCDKNEGLETVGLRYGYRF